MLSLAKNVRVWLVAIVYHITVGGGVGCGGVIVFDGFGGGG